MSSPLWTPSDERLQGTRIRRFMRCAHEQFGAPPLADYAELYDWSIQQPEAFWRAVWEFCGVRASQCGETTVVDGHRMTGARWFPDARLNFAENLLRRRDHGLALIARREDGQRRTLSYAQLADQVARVAASLRAIGVDAGDRVAGLLPNIPEAIVCMLASSSLGAIWTSCSPDFGKQGVIDRFGQIQPKVLFCTDGYLFKGRRIPLLEHIAETCAGIDGLERTVVVPLLDDAPDITGLHKAQLYGDFLAAEAELSFTRLPFDHPLYILYSSGTTGVPKCIVHGAGGTLLQHLKEHQLACDIGPDDVLFYFTSCGWMMWNWLASGLASGATLVLYDGTPWAEHGKVLLNAIDDEGITVFGTSARYIAALAQAGIRPRLSHRMDSLKTVLSTGSPLSDESFEYVYRDFKRDVCLSSLSGGTDIVSCFVGGSPLLPVYSGEIQCRGLGMAVEFRDEAGHALASGKGELVCTRPFPSMPIGFWDDTDNTRYHAAYFERFDQVWCHGDYGELTEHGGVIIHGRSDAVLNPGGVRIGTAEIYRQVEKVPEVVESVAIGQQWQGDQRIVLFVMLRPGTTLDETLQQRIRATIRQHASPRHVPARIVLVHDIPRTLSGKIVELAISDVVHGRAVRNVGALANPEALNEFMRREELAD